jgi:hypothetical protein
MYTLFTFLVLLLFFLTYNFLIYIIEKNHSFTENWLIIITIIIVFAISISLNVLVVTIIPIIILYMLVLFGTFMIKDVNQRKYIGDKTKNLFMPLLFIFDIFLILYVSYPSIIGQFESGIIFDISPFFQWDYLSSYTRNSIGWFLNLYGIEVTYLSIILYLVYACITKKLNHSFTLFVFIGLWFESILFNRYFSPRYVIFILPLFLLILSNVLILITSLLFKNEKKRLFVAILIVMVMIPWPKISTISSTTVGENLNLEIYYDFKGIIQTMPINKGDALIETSYGPFLLYQNASDNIIEMTRITTDGNGIILPKKDIEKKFIDTIKNYEHGWFLTDYYRFQKWNCDDYIPCEIRSFVNNNPLLFKRHEYMKDQQLIIFEWNRSEMGSIT